MSAPVPAFAPTSSVCSPIGEARSVAANTTSFAVPPPHSADDVDHGPRGEGDHLVALTECPSGVLRSHPYAHQLRAARSYTSTISAYFRSSIHSSAQLNGGVPGPMFTAGMPKSRSGTMSVQNWMPWNVAAA